MNRIIDFLKYRLIFLIASLVVLGAGLGVTIANEGFNLGVDFQAGLKQQVQIDPDEASAGIDDVRSALESIDGVQVQTLGEREEQRFNLSVGVGERDPDEASSLGADILSILRNEFGDGAVTEEGSEFVGPQFASNIAQQTFLLTVVALGLILLYVWIRFRLAYALSAIVPLLHDVAFMLVFIGAFQIEVSTATVAAVLTVIGYSLNDTIVIFDRIRENESLMRGAHFYEVVNTSITQSLSRTVITSATTLLAVFAILLFSTGTIQDFALSLIVGVIVGTYSSIAIASPTLLGLHKKVGKKKGATGGSEAPVRQQRGEQGTKQEPATAGAAAGGGSGNGTAPADPRKAADVKEEIRRQRAAAGKSSGSGTGKAKGGGGKKKKK
ncbi:MAG: protein translocase subunit SecF [Spirochaetota bacterium]